MNYVDICFTKDGGYTYSAWRKLPMGEVGDFMRRVVARRFGTARWIAFKVRVTDDVRADLVSVSVQTESAGP